MTDEPETGGATAARDTSRAVFLSYASDDADAAARIAAGLRSAGVEVWFDQSELRSGDAWDQKIRREIRDCALFVPIISRHTQARSEGYFRLEWHLADQRTHLMAKSRAFLLPVCVDGTRESDAEVPDSFLSVQWTRLAAGDAPPSFNERVSRLVSADEQPPPGARAPAGPSPKTPGAVGASATALAATAKRSSPPWRLALELLLATALVVGVGYFAVERLRSATPTAAKVATTVATAIPEKSIAVLPFADMSEKRDQEYFSDGMAEEIIDLLVKVPELHVPARTSSFYFKGKTEDIPTIARRLAVAHILEGSVRRSGNHMRVTAQLVRADTGYQLWSETYDRDVKDVFKLQNDIARVVVEKLKVTILDALPGKPVGAPNPEAYRLFLQGRFAMQRDLKEGLAQAVAYFEQAIAIDPGYALAWANLGYCEFRQVANGYIRAQDGTRKTSAAADKANALDPSLALPYLLRGTLKMSAAHDWVGARIEYDKALKLEPSSAAVLFNDAFMVRTVGSSDDAILRFRKVVELDPFNLLNRRYFARALYSAGKLDEAEATIRQVLVLDPTFSAAHYELGRILLARGQVGPAVAEFEAETNPAWRGFGLPLGYRAQGRTADANAGLAALLRTPDGQEFQIGETFAYFGNSDQAFAWLGQAVDHDPGIMWLRGDPLLAGITADPRYDRLLHRLNLPR